MRKWEIIHQTGWNMWEFSWGLHMELVSYKLVVVHEYHESKSISIRTAPSDVCSIMPPLFVAGFGAVSVCRSSVETRWTTAIHKWWSLQLRWHIMMMEMRPDFQKCLPKQPVNPVNLTSRFNVPPAPLGYGANPGKPVSFPLKSIGKFCLITWGHPALRKAPYTSPINSINITEKKLSWGSYIIPRESTAAFYHNYIAYLCFVQHFCSQISPSSAQQLTGNSTYSYMVGLVGLSPAK